MIMTAFKKIRSRAKRLRKKLAGLLPLEEYLADKLAKKARSNSVGSYITLMHLANIKAWDRMVHPDILENEGKNELAVSLVRRDIFDIIENGKEHILRKLTGFSSTLERDHFDMLLYCLSVANMKNTIARLASYPFIERNPGFDSYYQNLRPDDKLIDLKDFAEVLCHYIDCDGGPKAFEDTNNHNYVLLLYCAYHPSYAARIRAIEDFILKYFEDPLDFKEVILHTPYPETARYILNRLIKCGMITLEGDGFRSDSSLMIWHDDSLKYRGTDDPITNVIELILKEFGIDMEKIEDIRAEIFGIPKGPKN
jgi:hypothetical protein